MTGHCIRYSTSRVDLSYLVRISTKDFPSSSGMVFDVYSKDVAYSLPSKGRNDNGQFRHVSDLTQKLPSSSAWNSFLDNVENKRQITHLIIDYILSEVNPIPRKLYITKDYKCILRGGHRGNRDS